METFRHNYRGLLCRNFAFGENSPDGFKVRKAVNKKKNFISLYFVLIEVEYTA
jgi:hypothetical protein